MTYRTFARLLAVLALVCTGWMARAQDLRLPNAAASVTFAVIGNAGNGDRAQFEVAAQMLRVHATFPFDRVLMLGDNIYGGQSAQDIDRKFAQPYKGLLDRRAHGEPTGADHAASRRSRNVAQPG